MIMSPVSRGFRHFRRVPDEQAGRLPPGQYQTDGFPVLSAGPTPHTPLEQWTFSITQGGQTSRSWTWQEFRALPAETITADIIGGQAWVAFGYNGGSLESEHGGPARLLVPHLYFWKSAKWVRGLDLRDRDAPGFWETYGYHMYGDPWREQRYAGD